MPISFALAGDVAAAGFYLELVAIDFEFSGGDRRRRLSLCPTTFPAGTHIRELAPTI
jgi:hypothetical protein